MSRNMRGEFCYIPNPYYLTDKYPILFSEDYGYGDGKMLLKGWLIYQGKKYESQSIHPRFKDSFIEDKNKITEDIIRQIKK